MRRISIFLKSFIVSALLFSSFMVPNSFAENTLNPAPIKLPIQSNGYSILFDNSHGQTAGQSDWVIDGAFSDFADALVMDGYTVEEFRSNAPLTLSDLIDYDIFVIPEAQIPFTASEQDAIATYAELGGGVFFIADHYNADRNLNRWDSNEIMNGWRRGAYTNPTQGMGVAEAQALSGVVSSRWLSDEFGVEFRYNSIDNTVANVVVPATQSFGITNGVSEVSIHAGSTLAITNPTIAKGIVYLPTGLTSTANKWSSAPDQGVYAGGGVAEGPFVAIGKKGLGKSAFIGDSSPVEDATPKYRNEENGGRKTTYDGFIEDDNAEILINIIDWLVASESYTQFSQTSITLDTATPRITIEDPATSTEPSLEPWRQPASGYLWYDSTTFADGAYGSDVAPPAALTYTVTTPTTLPSNGNPFTATVKIAGLTPNSTVVGHQMQVYLSGGTAISQVQTSNGNWPTGYGYFDIGTLTANAQGIAEKVITMRLNPATTANVGTIRLKNSNGDNVVTKTVQIGEQSGEVDPPIDIPDPSETYQVFQSGNYKLLLPGFLPTHGTEFTVKVEISGLAANTAITNAQIQIYLAGGTSISQVKNTNGTWPTTYGYGNFGTLVANSTGVATGEIKMRINPTVTSTSASIRLRLGSGNNTITSTISLQ